MAPIEASEAADRGGACADAIAGSTASQRCYTLAAAVEAADNCLPSPHLLYNLWEHLHTCLDLCGALPAAFYSTYQR